jgi:hypothetical protein
VFYVDPDAFHRASFILNLESIRSCFRRERKSCIWLEGVMSQILFIILRIKFNG